MSQKNFFQIILFFFLTILPSAVVSQTEPLMIVEHFDSGINVPWRISTNTPGITWTTTDKQYDKTNPDSTHGAKAVSTSPGYPPKLQTWLIYTPIDLSKKTKAELLFSYLPDMETGSRLGVCITSIPNPSPEELFASRCYWYNQPDMMWRFERIDLTEYLGKSNISAGWVFDSGPSGSASKPGVFADEIQLRASEEPVVPPEDFGWQIIYKESFGTIKFDTASPWKRFTNQENINWNTTAQKFDPSDPTEPKSAAAIPKPHSGYSAGLKNWMIYGPVDFTGKQSAEIFFNYYMDAEETDWFGFCIGMEADPANFKDENCTWINSSTGIWRHEYRDLTSYAGQTGVYMAWGFKSEAGSSAKTGAFVDRIELLATDQKTSPMFDFTDDFVQWQPLLKESFDAADMYADAKWTAVSSQTGVTWKTANQKYDTSNPDSAQSAGISNAGAGYAKDLETWMIYGPLDLSSMTAGDIKFSVYYDLESEPDGKYDRLGFFISPGKSPQDIPPRLNSIPKIVWISGSSEGSWEQIHGDLKPFTGQSNIYLAWYVETPVGSDSKQGVFVDEIEIASQPKDMQSPKIGFESEGLWNQNGNFDQNSLFGWNLKDPGPGDGQVELKLKKNNYFPAISGNQIIYQPIDISSDISDLFVSFSYTVESAETVRGNDRFCVALTEAENTDSVIVDFGCWDAVDFPDFAKTEKGLTWDKFEKSLTDTQIETITQTGASQIGFVIMLEQDTGVAGKTTLFVDDINVYATGFSRRSTDESQLLFAPQRDPGEPNDSFDRATPIQCGKIQRGLFGDVGGEFDADYYRIVKVPLGTMIIDTNARSKQPSSAADTYIELYDKNMKLMASNDDDGESLDSKIVFNNLVDGGIYYIMAKSVHGGGADFFYDLEVQCGKKPSARTCPEPSRRTANSQQRIAGDINGDNKTDLSDAITALQIIADISTGSDVSKESDISGDSKIGTEEAVFVLQTIADLRETASDETWTMMLYLDAEDQTCVNYDDESLCWNNIYEESVRRIEAYIGEKKDFLNVIVLIDGPNFNDAVNDVVRYVIQPDGNYTEDENRWNLDEINMGDPDVLSGFVQWAMAAYPADHYYLAVHDHGHGIFGTAWDYHGADGDIDDYLTLPEIRSALKEITNNGEFRIDIFEYQACLMGMVENAYDIKDYTNYVALFQPVSWTSYNYPEYFRELKQGDDPLTVGRHIIQKYPVSDESYPYTFSLVDSAKLASLRKKTDAFAQAIMTADIDEIEAARNESQAFNGSSNKGDPAQDVIGYIDLWYLADRIAARGIAKTEANALKAALEDAVVESKATEKGGDPIWDYTHYHGLSILYPMIAFTFLEDYQRDYAMSQDGIWDEFLTENVFSGNSRHSGKKSGRQEDSRLSNAPEILQKSGIVKSP